jgi:Rad3-related DNA helicase
MGFFMDTLGGNSEDYKIILSSPFERKNLGLMVNSAVSTKYKDREATYRGIADLINCVINARRGNYLIFFSSYVYMENVHGIFTEICPQIKCLCQARGDKTNEFIGNFTEEKDEAFAGFAVLGAGYSEGIDLKGDKLIGAVVVGVGLPMISFERDIMRDYYEKKLNAGYEYAYVYPGINKVLQAAGRVIRKEDDKGAVLLIDTRYSESRYEELFPQEWYGYETVQKPEKVSGFLRGFWEGQ